MRISKVVCVVMTVTTLGMSAISVVPAQAAAKRLPKSFRGEWISKPIYTYEKKHVKENMAVPAMKFVVHSKTAKWQFKGYLPSGHDHLTHHLKISKIQKNFYTLKGDGPFGRLNYFSKSGKHLIYLYQNGGDITLTKVH